MTSSQGVGDLAIAIRSCERKRSGSIRSTFHPRQQSQLSQFDLSIYLAAAQNNFLYHILHKIKIHDVALTTEE